MNNETKQAYIDKSSAQIKEWTARVDLLKARMAKGTASMRIDFHAQVEKLQEKENILEQKLQELRSVGVEGYDVVKTAFHNMWTEVNLMVEKLEDKKNDLKN